MIVRPPALLGEAARSFSPQPRSGIADAAGAVEHPDAGGAGGYGEGDAAPAHVDRAAAHRVRVPAVAHAAHRDVLVGAHGQADDGIALAVVPVAHEAHA